MAIKNYYIILGISPSASAEGIRGAFRQLAKKFHPDKAGCEKTAIFQDITEAYEVLSNPEKRKLYNQKLTEERKRQKFSPVNVSIKPVFFGYDSNILEMDAFLTVQEAYEGTALNLRFSITVQCRWCGGNGYDFFFSCHRCRGSGLITRNKPIEIHLPPRLNHGDRIETFIDLSEKNYLHLSIHIYII